jgi:hypothetical protein
LPSRADVRHGCLSGSAVSSLYHRTPFLSFLWSRSPAAALYFGGTQFTLAEQPNPNVMITESGQGLGFALFDGTRIDKVVPNTPAQCTTKFASGVLVAIPPPQTSQRW